MAYAIEIKSRAERALKRLEPNIGRRVKVAISKLVTEPRGPGCKKLRGGQGYRVRVGDYRVVYEIDDGTRTVTVTVIADRKDVYR